MYKIMELIEKFVFSLYKMGKMFYSVYVCRFAMSSDGNRIRTGFLYRRGFDSRGTGQTHNI